MATIYYDINNDGILFRLELGEYSLSGHRFGWCLYEYYYVDEEKKYTKVNFHYSFDKEISLSVQKPEDTEWGRCWGGE